MNLKSPRFVEGLFLSFKNSEIHPIRLLFYAEAKDLEPEYRDEHYKTSLTQIRIALLVGGTFYAVFGFLDAAIVPIQKYEFWFIRYAIVCPLAFSLFIFSFFRMFKTYLNLCLFILCVAAGFGIVLMTAKAAPPANYSYYAGLILVIIYLFTFVKMSFLWAVAASWSIIIFYEIIAVWVIKAPYEILLNNNFFIIGSVIYCMIAGYSIEYFERRNFILRRLLSDEKNTVARMNADLEKKIKERTQELESANLRIMEDADRRIQLENKLAQAQKMESIGRLAGGVAHDYNNISSIIIGYSELALEKVNRSEDLYDDLMEIYSAAKRSTEITRQLLAFARQQTISPKVLDLNDIVEGMLKMLKRLIGEDIDLAWFPGVDVGLVKIDPSQVDQILANLCVNARDAIADVGKVTIETKNAHFDAAYCAEHVGFVEGEFVLLAVSDDGSGIPSENLGNIFEPFFTTKATGKGTGLGLATVYGIVKQNNGFINVYSEPENGTSIRIYLPRHVGNAKPTQPQAASKIPLSRGESVLLVEDDGSILKLGETILNDLGYNVLSSKSPVDAIRLAKDYIGKIHLLITDVVMPEMNGRELSEQLQTLYPDLNTLFMSGYTANVIAHRGVLEDGVNFISKPFSKNDLAFKVRQVLDNATIETHA